MEAKPNPLATAESDRRVGRNVPDSQLVRLIASTLQAKINCENSGNSEWRARHDARLARLVREYMPSGSGIDCGTKLDKESRPDRLIFNTEFHHMNDGGFYDGWTQHRVTVTPSFVYGVELKISGRNRNDIKDYLGEIFAANLSAVIPDSDWVALCEEESN